MTTNLPKTYSTPATSLGTAGWYQFAPGVTPQCSRGDFFLSRLPSGHPVGLRDDRHVMVCAGTRSGKGTSVIVPNLAFWCGSAVVIDPKGENAIVTARRRGKGSAYSKGLKQEVCLLDPFSEVETEEDDFADIQASYNPLDLVDPFDDESIDVAARIADALVVSESSNEPFWEEAGRSLIKAVILHVASSDKFGPEERNLSKVRDLITAGDKELRDLMILNGSKPKKTPSAFALLFNTMRKSTAFGGEVGRLGEQL